jgi:hypothetical protein
LPSIQHLQEYPQGTYDEAGSVHSIAAVLKGLPKKPTLVYVCRDGTNFKEKLLRYFAYPIRISSSAEDAMRADMAVVMNKYSWNFKTSIDAASTRSTLSCGDLARDARRVSSFEDGSILFSLDSSPPTQP